MTGRLLKEIRQAKPFRLAEEEAFLNLQRTADALMQRFSSTLKPYGLSAVQYNVLRILRGAGSSGLQCGEVGIRMVTHDPDITRLLDRMEARGFVSRSREQRDRRVITTRITEKGLKLLTELDEPVLTKHRALLGHLGPRRVQALIRLLEQARQGAA